MATNKKAGSKEKKESQSQNHLLSFDRHAYEHSMIHLLDPRSKIIITLLFIISVVINPVSKIMTFVFFLIIIFWLILTSGLPFSYVLKRSLIILPFSFLVAVFAPFIPRGNQTALYELDFLSLKIYSQGLLIMANAVVKSWLSVLAVIILYSTTPFPDILKGLEKLKVPKILINVISFTFRYLFLFIEEFIRLKKARDSRLSTKSRIRQWRSLGYIIGSLLIRAYERGERIYKAMLSRGYDGQIRSLKTLKLKAADLTFIFGFTIVLLIIQFLS